MNRSPLLALTALVLMLALPAYAADPAPLPEWDRLSPAQRELLIAPLRERWNSHPHARPRMLKHAQRWSAMTPEQRAKARHGIDQWQGMTPEQRIHARRAFEQMRHLDPEQRRALREKLKAMTPEQRRAWFQAQATKAPPRR